MNDTLIKFEKLEKYYLVNKQKQLIIKGVDLEIKKGEIVAILGKSGSGKSTLLNILGLLDRHTGGDYFLEDKEVSSYTANELAKIRNQKFGFIFQQFNLLSKLSVIENVYQPLYYTHNSKVWSERKARAMKLLEMLDIGEQADKKPKLLSGGQQQRVAIARSLVNNPEVIIGDEPTGALDSKTAVQITQELFRLNKELGVTIILVTHDDDLAAKCPRVIRLKDGLVVNEFNDIETDDKKTKTTIIS